MLTLAEPLQNQLDPLERFGCVCSGASDLISTSCEASKTRLALWLAKDSITTFCSKKKKMTALFPSRVRFTQYGFITMPLKLDRILFEIS